MKKIVSILLGLTLPFLVAGQTIDDSSIKKLESGQYSLEKGKIQVAFADTVSSAFVEAEFDKLGYQILSSTFQPIVLSIENAPDAQQMNKLEENEWVDFIMSESVGISDENLEELSENDSLKSSRINAMLTQFNRSGEYKFVMVGLKYSATEEVVNSLQKQFPDLDIRISKKSTREAVVKTEDDKEAETMEELQKLSYVKNTAYIGSLN